MAARILVVEDEARVASVISRGLRLEGYQVEVAPDGETALDKALSAPPDMIILDVMLPDIDGLEVCRQLRAAGGKGPVLMLTAKDAIPDRVAGLDAGADDYLVKPFDFDELRARIRALLRRTTPADTKTLLSVADLELDLATRHCQRAGRPIQLTTKEFDLLELFMRHPNQVLTRDIIYDRVWDYDFAGESNIIDVYVRYLRAKTEEAGGSRLIHTVRGVGYVLREE
jgi:two-component system, OmpR family, response regulator MprA